MSEDFRAKCQFKSQVFHDISALVVGERFHCTSSGFWWTAGQGPTGYYDHPGGAPCFGSRRKLGLTLHNRNGCCLRPTHPQCPEDPKKPDAVYESEKTVNIKVSKLQPNDTVTVTNCTIAKPEDPKTFEQQVAVEQDHLDTLIYLDQKSRKLRTDAEDDSDDTSPWLDQDYQDDMYDRWAKDLKLPPRKKA
jgi:hypothetical protein